MGKYHARKTTIDGITFDSNKEAKRYELLKGMQENGKITNLVLQPKFELQPHFKKYGKTIRAINYVADFQYFSVLEQKLIVEDVKGFRTDVYLIKKKLFDYNYPDLELREV